MILLFVKELSRELDHRKVAGVGVFFKCKAVGVGFFIRLCNP